jgi:hypothetical protein
VPLADVKAKEIADEPPTAYGCHARLLGDETLQGRDQRLVSRMLLRQDRDLVAESADSLGGQASGILQV